MEAGGKIKGGNHWKVRDLDLDARSSTQQFYPGSPDSGMWWPSVKEKKVESQQSNPYPKTATMNNANMFPPGFI